MATVTIPQIVETLIENGGYFPGDTEPVWAIYEYRHRFVGRIMWAIFYDPRHVDIHSSHYVEKFCLLWQRDKGQVAPIGVLEEES